MQDFGKIVGVDPWFFSALDAHITDTDINADAARAQIATKVNEMLLNDVVLLNALGVL